MDVQLYVYDLSQGLARTMSMQFLGIQIDAVYHTSVVFSGTEYFFGQGIQMCRAGMSHHGQPMQVLKLGKTDLPLDIIEEYLGALRATYSPESYDLFAHNCNNFSNDFAQFLVGTGIPEYITNLPRQVLETPFGRMLQPQLDASMRSVTQAPVPAHAVPIGSDVHVNESTPRAESTEADAKDLENMSQSALEKPSPQRKHPHSQLKLTVLEHALSRSPLASKLPDFQELKTHFERDTTMIESVDFLDNRLHASSIDVALPDVHTIVARIEELWPKSTVALQTRILDVTRLLLLDERVAIFLVETSVLEDLLHGVSMRADTESSLLLVGVQIACNCFSTTQLARVATKRQSLSAALVEVTVKGLLSQDEQQQTWASNAALNMCGAQFTAKRTQFELADAKATIVEERAIELAVALIEVLSMVNTHIDCIRNCMFALGGLLYMSPVDSELHQTAASLGAADIIQSNVKELRFEERDVVDEIGQLLQS
ncbi:MAG: hypothetical protein Q9159_000686 [Coniocarpon cinnabarinum]